MNEIKVIIPKEIYNEVMGRTNKPDMFIYPVKVHHDIVLSEGDYNRLMKNKKTESVDDSIYGCYVGEKEFICSSCWFPDMFDYRCYDPELIKNKRFIRKEGD